MKTLSQRLSGLRHFFHKKLYKGDVCYVSSCYGSDDNSGSEKESPFATIEKAMSSFNGKGGAIRVLPGYYGKITIDDDGIELWREIKDSTYCSTIHIYGLNAYVHGFRGGIHQG